MTASIPPRVVVALGGNAIARPARTDPLISGAVKALARQLDGGG
jgi:hypothetical protein